MKIKYLFLLLLCGLFAVWASSFFEQNRAASIAERSEQRSLSERNQTVLYQPGKGEPGVPMSFDRLDLTSHHAIKYFANHGFSGFKDRDPAVVNNKWLDFSGFPVINVVWPSLALNPKQVCSNEGASFTENCPVGSFQLRSGGSSNSRLFEILKQEKSFENQAKVMPKYREIRQWTAFFTDKNGTTEVQDKWLGWQCDSNRVEQMNLAVGAWGWEEKLWAQRPTDFKNDCYYVDSQWQKQLLRYKPEWANITENPVVWTCPQHQEGEDQDYIAPCKVAFIHQGRLIELEIPSRTDATKTAPFQKQHHLIVQATWQWLQNAAQRAEQQQNFDTKQALETEFAWCEQLDKESQRLSTKSKKSANKIQELWDESEYRITNIYPRNVCSRTLHRVLQARAAVANKQPISGLDNKMLLSVVNKLSQIEERQTGQENEQPLRDLKNSLLAKVYGKNSIEAFSSIMTPQYIFKTPVQALERYQAMGDKLLQLSPERRNSIRLELSNQLWSDQYREQNSARRELVWAIVEELRTNDKALDFRDSVSALQFAGIYTRNRDIGVFESPPQLEQLIKQMEHLAKKIAVDSTIKPVIRENDIAVLGINAAWHANKLVVTKKNARYWKQWLKQWHAWVAHTLQVDTQGYDTPHWMKAIEAHVDAAQDNKMTDPDCAGGAYNSCRLGLVP